MDTPVINTDNVSLPPQESAQCLPPKATITTAKRQNRKKNLIEALKRNAGLISYACEAVGCERSTYYDYYNGDEHFRKAVDDISESVVDYSEKALIKQIKKGNTTAIIFHLKCKGKKRGYVERQEIDMSMEAPTQRMIIGGKEVLF